jgi:hypothetical protein
VSMEIERAVLGRLREMAIEGAGVCVMARWLLERLSISPAVGRIYVIAYIQQAFCISAGDASAVGAWHAFPGGTWADDEVEKFLLPRIRAAKAKWAHVEG